MKWYVLFAQYHYERVVHERVMRQGFQPYLPLAAVWRKSQRGLRQVATPVPALRLHTLLSRDVSCRGPPASGR